MHTYIVCISTEIMYARADIIMSYRYGRGGRGRGGAWQGNGPFRDIPPWERPGWLYGPGSCWTLGYRTYAGIQPASVPSMTPTDEMKLLQDRREVLEGQLRSIQKVLEDIQSRLSELERVRQD
jgi:hypothetical protein